MRQSNKNNCSKDCSIDFSLCLESLAQTKVYATIFLLICFACGGKNANTLRAEHYARVFSCELSKKLSDNTGNNCKGKVEKISVIDNNLVIDIQSTWEAKAAFYEDKAKLCEVKGILVISPTGKVQQFTQTFRNEQVMKIQNYQALIDALTGIVIEMSKK
jgi:hypothetical protein